MNDDETSVKLGNKNSLAFQPGCAIFAKIDVGVGWEVAFMVREESARIPHLGRWVILRTGSSSISWGD